MTDTELKELLANLIKSQQETDRQFRATDKRIEELAKQIGGLGNKFGSFTEGMAFPALEKLLRHRFGMEVVTTRTRAKRNGAIMEIDMLAYAEEGDIYIVEIKSHLRNEDLTQLVQILTNFPQFFPHYAQRPRYGLLAVIDASENLKQQVFQAGIYLATINDDQFTLQIPETFQAKPFI